MSRATLTTSRARRPARSTSLWAALLAALVFFSGLEVHLPGDAHDTVAGGTQQVYYPGASHPQARHHAEPGQAAERPLCPACLNRLQTSGAYHAPAVQLPAPSSDERLRILAAATPLARSQRPRGARAPPLA